MPPEPEWTKIDELINCGKLAEALSTAIEDLERTKPEDGESHYLALSRLAMVYTAQGRYEQSIVALREVARFVSEKYGEQHPQYLLIVCRLAEDCLQCDRVDEAGVFASKALEIINHFGGETDLQYPLVLSLQARVRQKQGDLAGAELLHIRSLRIRSRHFGKGHWRYAGGLFYLAVNYKNRGRMLPAHQALERILRMKERVQSANALLYAKALRELGLVNEDRGDLHRASELATRSLEILVRHGGGDGPNARQVRDLLQRLSVKQSGRAEPIEGFDAKSWRVRQLIHGNRERRSRVAASDATYPPGFSS